MRFSLFDFAKFHILHYEIYSTYVKTLQIMKKVLIAGGTGFVGQVLIKHLLECGYRVNVLARKNTANDTYGRCAVF